MAPRWLRPQEAAAVLGCSLRTLQNIAKRGQVMRRREGRTSRYCVTGSGAGASVARDAAFIDERRQVCVIVSWKQPQETQLLVRLLEALHEAGARVEVAMEPTGTYGDPLRFALLARGLPVFRVSPKRSHDAAEVYDGVPSWHDRKSAALIAKLHLDGASEPWPLRSDDERGLAAAIRTMGMFDDQRPTNGLEAPRGRRRDAMPDEADPVPPPSGHSM